MPIVPGHLLICPIRHVSAIDELTDTEFAAIKQAIVKLRPLLKQLFKAEGFNYAWNEGELAGQSVNHLHVHMLPRTMHDAGIYEYEPRKFLYRPGTRATTPDQELLEVAEEIKACLSNTYV